MLVEVVVIVLAFVGNVLKPADEIRVVNVVGVLVVSERLALEDGTISRLLDATEILIAVFVGAMVGLALADSFVVFEGALESGDRIEIVVTS